MPGALLCTVFWTCVVTILIVGATVRPARSDDFPVIGYRLEVGVCGAAGCRVILESVEPWTVQKSCEDQGDLLLEAVRPNPSGPTVKARCVAVRGLRSA